MTVACNTTMNHLLLGVDANALRTEPFIPAFFHIDPMPAKDIGIELAPGAMLRIAPNIGSYVGGDITAGALAGMIWNRPELALFIDLGTNGEIVLGNSEFLVACACSAGPAFEGGDISCGMRAIDGAIEGCEINKETMEPVFSVIGGQKPVGLCGSGIIDVTAELFRTGIINGKGKFVREGERVKFDEFGIGSFTLAFAEESASGRAVTINEVDLDNFIRAKGAIFSAILTLLGALGFSPSEVRHVDVAGGIGSGINIKNAIGIGMFPDLPLDKYRYVGNTSLAGAYAMLVSKAAVKHLLKLSKEMTYLELSVQPGYMDAFVAACFLPTPTPGCSRRQRSRKPVTAKDGVPGTLPFAACALREKRKSAVLEWYPGQRGCCNNDSSVADGEAGNGFFEERSARATPPTPLIRWPRQRRCALPDCPSGSAPPCRRAGGDRA